MGKKDDSRYFRVRYSLYRIINGDEEFIREETVVKPYRGPFPKGYWDGFNIRHEFDKTHRQVWYVGRLYRKVYISHEEITYDEW